MDTDSAPQVDSHILSTEELHEEVQKERRAREDADRKRAKAEKEKGEVKEEMMKWREKVDRYREEKNNALKMVQSWKEKAEGSRSKGAGTKRRSEEVEGLCGDP